MWDFSCHPVVGHSPLCFLCLLSCVQIFRAISHSVTQNLSLGVEHAALEPEEASDHYPHFLLWEVQDAIIYSFLFPFFFERGFYYIV